MEKIPKTDELFLILHKTGWLTGDTAFVDKERIT